MSDSMTSVTFLFFKIEAEYFRFSPKLFLISSRVYPTISPKSGFCDSSEIVLPAVKIEESLYLVIPVIKMKRYFPELDFMH